MPRGALELYLRSRLALLAGLELQGHTRPSTGCVVGPLVRALQGMAGHNHIKRWFAVQAERVRADDHAAQWDRTAQGSRGAGTRGGSTQTPGFSLQVHSRRPN